MELGAPPTTLLTSPKLPSARRVHASSIQTVGHTTGTPTSVTRQLLPEKPRRFKLETSLLLPSSNTFHGSSLALTSVTKSSRSLEPEQTTTPMVPLKG